VSTLYLSCLSCVFSNVFKHVSKTKILLNHLTIGDKVHVKQLVQKSNPKKQDTAKEFNIPPNTLSTFLKNKADILILKIIKILIFKY